MFNLLDALRTPLPLLVVVNESLMNNHQLELAEAIADEGYALAGSVTDFISVLQEAKIDELVPFPAVDKHAFGALLNDEMGIYKTK